MTLHRRPGEESVGLYPGLVVSDGDHSRVSGSITVGRSRLPVWAFIAEVVRQGWDATEDYYTDGYEEELGREATATFFHSLMELRGEFGRLLLVLADAERCEDSYRWSREWAATKRHQKRVGDQLRRCLEVLERESGSPTEAG